MCHAAALAPVVEWFCVATAASFLYGLNGNNYKYLIISNISSVGFIGSGNCDVSGDHWIQSQRRRMVHAFVTSRIDY